MSRDGKDRRVTQQTWHELYEARARIWKTIGQLEDIESTARSVIAELRESLSDITKAAVPSSLAHFAEELDSAVVALDIEVEP